MAHTPKVEPLALDEAFLDVSGAMLLFGSPAEIGARIREHITSELGLTASVGVARNKLLAKLAATKAKPDGLLAHPRRRIPDFLFPFPSRPVGCWGKDGRDPRRLGIRTVGELARTPRRHPRPGPGRGTRQGSPSPGQRRGRTLRGSVRSAEIREP